MQPIVLYSGFLPATIKIEDYCNKKDFGNYLMIPDEFLQYKATTLIDKCLYYIHGCKLLQRLTKKFMKHSTLRQTFFGILFEYLFLIRYILCFSIR